MTAKRSKQKKRNISVPRFLVGGEGFEPPKAFANGFTVRPGSPTPASAQNNAKLKASDKYIFIQTKMQIFYIITDYAF